MATRNLSGSKITDAQGPGSVCEMMKMQKLLQCSSSRPSSPWGPATPCLWAGAHFPPGGCCTHTPPARSEHRNSPSSVPSHLQVMSQPIYQLPSVLTCFPKSFRFRGEPTTTPPGTACKLITSPRKAEDPSYCRLCDGREATTALVWAPRVEAAVKKQRIFSLCLDSMKQYSVAQDSEPT